MALSLFDHFCPDLLQTLTKILIACVKALFADLLALVLGREGGAVTAFITVRANDASS